LIDEGGQLSHSRRVYLAAPVWLYEHSYYDFALATIREFHPNTAVIDARSAWPNSFSWKRDFSRTVRNVEAAYFLTWPNGGIGAGQWAELRFLTDREHRKPLLKTLHVLVAPEKDVLPAPPIKAGKFCKLAPPDWSWNNAAILVPRIKSEDDTRIIP
jgi:hypothetical protein